LVVLVNVSAVVAPAPGESDLPSVLAVHPILVVLWPDTSNEKFWLVDPNDTVSVLFVGDPKQLNISPAVFPASANVTSTRARPGSRCSETPSSSSPN
jgi:hypothetical protein